ncbi:hypothetical protein MPER_01473 [Moniliophthora perniciosa FA553]|nr:hypothetical protein MPER_01473 [Moniliophthora perniciosa FA553]
MTRQKNEIANGMRLENASWRTWWKQRNNLKTVNPETLNWSVVTSYSRLISLILRIFLVLSSLVHLRLSYAKRL